MEMTSPWRKIPPVVNDKSFDDITAEEKEISLQAKELKKYCKNIETQSIEEIDPFEFLDDTKSDGVIAQLLQNQFNNEYDLMLKKTEDRYNAGSKVGISLENFRASSSFMSVDENVNPQEENPDVDRFVSIEKEYASIPKCGYKKSAEGSEIVTKHDILMSSRINACRVLEFPPGISTGDTGGFDVKLNNKVYNSLRAHSHAHCAREKAKARPPQK